MVVMILHWAIIKIIQISVYIAYNDVLYILII